MINDNNVQRSPHGVTGDTVQQAAEVSKPTSPLNEVRPNPETTQVPPDLQPAITTGANPDAGR
jgi:hypothetical protein